MKKTFLLILTIIVQFVSAQQETELKVENFPIPVFTNSNLSLLILGSAWNITPEIGDEIAIINYEGAIVGNSIVLEGHNGMAIWGDSPSTTVKDGLLLGERFGIIHWIKKKDRYFLYKDFKIQTGTVTYIKDGFTIITSLEKAEKYTRNSDVYYHLKSVLSDSHKFSFYAQKSDKYSLIVSTDNSILFEVKNTFFEKGYYSFDFNNTIPRDSYTLTLKQNSKSIVTKIFKLIE